MRNQMLLRSVDENPIPLMCLVVGRGTPVVFSTYNQAFLLFGFGSSCATVEELLSSGYKPFCFPCYALVNSSLQMEKILLCIAENPTFLVSVFSTFAADKFAAKYHV
jgi:hypothetical protein